jgi:hypothetical protein
MKTKFILFVLVAVMEVSAQQTFTRNILFEEATNASCGPCAASNPILKAYIESKGDTVIPIKYHASWPGTDPMYSANTTQNTERIQYMGVSAVPHLNVDGIIFDVWPFSTANFTTAFTQRITKPTPVGMEVIDERIGGGQIKATVNLRLPAALPAGTYKLRVMAIEKKITYASAPGSNGETVFEQVFRRAYPNTAGTAFDGNAGNYSFQFTYTVESNWVDSMIYTTAFLQNDINKEVINAASSKHRSLSIVGNQTTVSAQLNAGWNLVSVPLVVGSMNAQALFPGASSAVFSYNNGYFTQTTLSNGRGYWVRYPAATPINFTGTVYPGLSITVAAGWNLIGPFQDDVPTSYIFSDPSGIVNSEYYGYENGYVAAATLLKGRGYWVRVSQAGTLSIIPPPGEIPPPPTDLSRCEKK